MNKILEIGEYTLEEGTTIERTGRFVSVRPLIKYTNKPRCSDCKYFSHGRATKCGYTTTVCLLQPKNITDKDGRDLYYHIGQRQIACSKFTKKLKENKVMKANELLDKALDFIVETQEQNDYICEQMCEEYVGDYCANNCQNLNKECVKLFLQKVYNKG